jgi:hypothetical protein
MSVIESKRWYMVSIKFFQLFFVFEILKILHALVFTMKGCVINGPWEALKPHISAVWG